MIHSFGFNVLLLTSAFHCALTTDWHYSGQNVAYRNTASQFPGTYESYNASLAVDGNNDTEFDHGSCTHTNIQNGPASWTVQLGGSFRISGIIIFNRHDLYNRRRLLWFKVFGNGTILIYDDARNNKSQEEVIHIPTDKLQWFNSITIQIPAQNGDSGILTLCEVQVFEVPTPTCKTLLSRDINGIASIYGNSGSIVDGKNTVGTIIAFSCNYNFNYHLEGSAYIECLSSGKYNASVPRCSSSQNLCNVLSSEDLMTGNFSRVRYTDGSYVNGGIVVGTIIAFSCFVGNVIDGSAYIECLSSGTYNASVPKCLATCNSPPYHNHGTFTQLKSQYLEGDKVHFYCDIGYLPTRNYILRCEDNHRWIGDLPNCKKIKCDFPGNITNGYYTTGNALDFRVYLSALLPFETVITAVCEPGYTSNGELSRMCQGDRKWSGQQPVCYPIVCNNLAPVEHVTYFFQNRSSYSFNAVPLNTSLYISCDKGYTIKGPKETMCIGKNVWSNQGTTCKIVTCKYPEPIQNGFYIQDNHLKSENAEETQISTVDKLEYSVKIVGKCALGNNLKTTYSSRSCLETGEWSGETAVCVPVMCKWPLKLSGGSYEPPTLVGTGLPYNTTLKATCNPDYSISGNRYRRCNESGHWGNEPAVCDPLCKFPNVAGINDTINIHTFFKIGESVMITCKQGYSLSTIENITCHDNHEWSGNPECSAISTSERLESDNSAVIGGVTTSVLVVLLGVGVLVFFLFRRRNTLLHKKLPFARKKGHTSRSSQNNISDRQLSELHNEYENDHETAEVNHTYSNSLLRPPIHQGKSSFSQQSENGYYSFTSKDKLPETAIKVKDLSDFVLAADRVKEDFEKQFKKLPQGMSEAHSEALKFQNKGKNRYKNLYAYDETRVKLDQEEESESDYINACYVHGFDKHRKYIASQGPTKEILADFWKMIWQEDCSKIVVLTNLVEEGKNKCDKYWPDEGSITYDRVTVTMKATEIFSKFLIRTFTVAKDRSPSRTVTQFHFTAWPDKGVPKYASSLVHFMAKVKYATSTGQGPTVVHCSAGVGRTGTFIALENLTDQGNALGYVDVAGMVTSLRKQRVCMVQTLEQYIFVHRALIETLMLSTSSLPSSKFPEAFQELLQVDQIKKKRKISIEFETLKQISPEADDDQYVTSREVRNRQKNRYSNVLPVEEFMPALSPFCGSVTDTEYINAVYLPSDRDQKAFIIAQTPLESTKQDFWRLVWEHDVHTIVMMDNELDIKDTEVYWPNEGEKATFGNIVVTNDGTEEINQHMIMSMTIKFHAMTRYVNIMQCVGWQHRASLPDSPEVILSLLDIVQASQQQTGNHTIVVHCLNGADKSGLYCVISAVIERLKIEQDVAISQVIEEMRNAREQIIPTVAQYQFCHEAVLAFMNQYETYANFAAR